MPGPLVFRLGCSHTSMLCTRLHFPENEEGDIESLRPPKPKPEEIEWLVGRSASPRSSRSAADALSRHPDLAREAAANLRCNRDTPWECTNQGRAAAQERSSALGSTVPSEMSALGLRPMDFAVDGLAPHLTSQC